MTLAFKAEYRVPLVGTALDNRFENSLLSCVAAPSQSDRPVVTRHDRAEDLPDFSSEVASGPISGVNICVLDCEVDLRVIQELRGQE